VDILIIEDEVEIREALADILRPAGHAIVEAGDGERATALLAERAFDVILSDVRLPGQDGLELLRFARKVAPLTDFILMTAYGEVAQAVGALKDGASDYLTKPIDNDELLLIIGRIEGTRAMRRELAEARRTLAARPTQHSLVGNSAPMTKIRARVGMIAPSDAATLVLGESGTGKELVARMIHDASPRAGKPFVAVNCAAFPDTLIEAELFGFERGAFTGAVKRREGRFRAADGGTLFLDEIAELPLPAQAKLLRVLQEGMVEPLGTDQSIQVDVRIVSATHRNLRERVAQGLFREDLYYRINVLGVALPPLREREGDLPILIEFFLQGFAKTDSSGSRVVPAYPFPGNVRELAHAIEHAVVLAGQGEITIDHLPEAIAEAAPSGSSSSSDVILPEGAGARVAPLAVALRELEKQHLRRALAATGGKRVKAAEMLGISR
jgi:DNA-binding NtrC family response regulator